MKIKMIATQPLIYEHKQYNKGDIFEIGNERIEAIVRTHEYQGTAKRLQQTQEETDLPITNISDILNWKKDNNYIVEDFIFPKTVNMLYSPPSGYKSLLSLDMSLSVSTGDTWLGLKTKKGKVLILDRENSQKTIRDRVVCLVNGRQWTKRKANSAKLNMIIRHGMLDNDEFVDQIHEFTVENDVKMIIFDTLRRFGDWEENSSDSINKLYTTFQKIIEGTNAAIVFLHHSSKDEKSYRGSVDLLGQVDTCYKVRRINKTDDFRLICEKSRSGEMEEIEGHIDWDKETEETKITRKDIEDTKEESDRYAKFKLCRTWVKNTISEICPIKGNIFLRKALMKELDVINPDRNDDERFSVRLVDSVLNHLVKTKYLNKTGAKGEYRRLFEGSDGVFDIKSREL